VVLIIFQRSSQGVQWYRRKRGERREYLEAKRDLGWRKRKGDPDELKISCVLRQYGVDGKKFITHNI
jgi:hypothetical protein